MRLSLRQTPGLLQFHWKSEGVATWFPLFFALVIATILHLFGLVCVTIVPYPRAPLTQSKIVEVWPTSLPHVEIEWNEEERWSGLKPPLLAPFHLEWSRQPDATVPSFCSYSIPLFQVELLDGLALLPCIQEPKSPDLSIDHFDGWRIFVYEVRIDSLSGEIYWNSPCGVVDKKSHKKIMEILQEFRWETQQQKDDIHGRVEIALYTQTN